MRVLLARHGETRWNVEGRYQGQGFDIPLSDSGLQQADALARRLATMDLARVVSSPLSRARQTAEAALAGRSLPLTIEPGLSEVAYGAWEGRLDAEVALEDEPLKRQWRESPERVTFPGGESLERVRARAWPAFCRACQGLDGDQAVLVVSHDGTNRVLLCQILGLSLSRIWSFRQAPVCLNLLEGLDVDRLTVVRLNDAVHVAPLFGEAVHRRI